MTPHVVTRPQLNARSEPQSLTTWPGPQRESEGTRHSAPTGARGRGVHDGGECRLMQDVKGSDPSRLSGGDKIPLLGDASSCRTQDAALQAPPCGSWEH